MASSNDSPCIICSPRSYACCASSNVEFAAREGCAATGTAARRKATRTGAFSIAFLLGFRAAEPPAAPPGRENSRSGGRDSLAEDPARGHGDDQEDHDQRAHDDDRRPELAEGVEAGLRRRLVVVAAQQRILLAVGGEGDVLVLLGRFVRQGGPRSGGL